MLIKDFIQIQMGVWLAFWDTLKMNPLTLRKGGKL